jgi:hypothetical protein
LTDAGTGGGLKHEPYFGVRQAAPPVGNVN